MTPFNMKVFQSKTLLITCQKICGRAGVGWRAVGGLAGRQSQVINFEEVVIGQARARRAQGNTLKLVLGVPS